MNLYAPADLMMVVMIMMMPIIINVKIMASEFYCIKNTKGTDFNLKRSYWCHAVNSNSIRNPLQCQSLCKVVDPCS